MTKHKASGGKIQSTIKAVYHQRISADLFFFAGFMRAVIHRDVAITMNL
jgi:hypothetical protein